MSYDVTRKANGRRMIYRRALKFLPRPALLLSCEPRAAVSIDRRNADRYNVNRLRRYCSKGNRSDTTDTNVVRTTGSRQGKTDTKLPILIYMALERRSNDHGVSQFVTERDAPPYNIVMGTVSTGKGYV